MQRWLLSFLLNLFGLVIALWFVYRAGLNIIILYSARVRASNPLFGVLVHDVPIALIGLVAVWVCFRTIGNLYELARKPPRA